jgi:hypothetical protein
MKAVKLMLILVVLLIVTPVVSAKKISIQTVSDTITQRESDWYCKYISSSSFSVYLVWNNPSNSLTLTIYSPSGEVYGYHDADDGKVDGKITLNVVNAEYGIWYFKVYGEKVSDVQAYSLTIT